MGIKAKIEAINPNRKGLGKFQLVQSPMLFNKPTIK
jgi:hypothetical protein